MVFVHRSRNVVWIRHRFCSVAMMPAIVGGMPVVNASLEQATVDDKSEVFASREISALPQRANAATARVMIPAVFLKNALSVVLTQIKMESVKALSRMVSMISVVLVAL